HHLGQALPLRAGYSDLGRDVKGLRGAGLVRMDCPDRRAESHSRQIDCGAEGRRPGAGCTQTPQYLYSRVLRPFRPSLCRLRPQGSAKRSPLLLRRLTSSPTRPLVTGRRLVKMPPRGADLAIDEVMESSTNEASRYK